MMVDWCGVLPSILQPYKWQVILALVLVLGTSAADLAGPFLTKIAIDNYIAVDNLGGLWLILVLFLVTLLLGFGLRYSQTYLMQCGRAESDVRYAGGRFSHIQRLPLAFFDRNPVGRLMSRLTSDIDALNELLTNGLVAILGDLVTLFAVVIIMVLLDWRLALVCYAVLSLVAVVCFVIQKYLRQTYRMVRSRLARINAFLQENVSGMLVAQLFNREAPGFPTVYRTKQQLLRCYHQKRSDLFAILPYRQFPDLFGDCRNYLGRERQRTN